MVLTTQTVKQALAWGDLIIAQEKIDSSRLDAELLLAFVLKKERIDLLCSLQKELNNDDLLLYQALVRRRAGYEPLAYILGAKEFMGLTFKVGPEVLIPRCDTELIVEEALKFLKNIPNPQVIDVCSGSGCIGISIAYHCPSARVICSDVSLAAVQTAQKNVDVHGLNDRVICQAGNLLDNFSSLGQVQLICANPPYITCEEFTRLMPDVARFEPYLALVDEGDGVSFHRVLLMQALPLLCSGGKIIFEIGYNQRQLIEKISIKGFLPPIIKVDYAGNDWCVIFERE